MFLISFNLKGSSSYDNLLRIILVRGSLVLEVDSKPILQGFQQDELLTTIIKHQLVSGPLSQN